MRPVDAAVTGQVRLVCCIPRGELSLSAAFDKSAYAAGETAQVRAVIANESESDVKHMKIKLMRYITLVDGKGRRKEIVDVVASAAYPGVDKHTTRTQDMPLALSNAAGTLLPGTAGQRVQIKYRFDVECDLACAPDIEVCLPVCIYSPAPVVWGLQSLGLVMPLALGGQVPLQAQPSQHILVPIPQQQAQAYPPQQAAGAYPPQQAAGAYPPQQAAGAYPPQQAAGAYPPQQAAGAYPPQQAAGAYPPQQAAYPPQQAVGYPPTLPGSPIAGQFVSSPLAAVGTMPTAYPKSEASMYGGSGYPQSPIASAYEDQSVNNPFNAAAR